MPVKMAGLTLAVAATAACLPRGAPPAGQQLLTDRSASLAALVPPNGDGLLRILLMRPGTTSNAANLSVVSLDANNRLSPELPLISDIDPVSSVNCPGGVAPCGFDPNGRAEVFTTKGETLFVDPVTGDVQPPTPADQHPAGQRYYVYQTPTSGTLVDPDGHTTPIQLASPDPNVYFPPWILLASQDFYYVDSQHDLIDIPLSDVPEQVATGVTFYTFWTTSSGPMLVLTRTTADGSTTQSSVGDPRSGMETVLPFDPSKATISPDGRWVLDTQNQLAGQLTFFDRSTGAQHSVDLGLPAQFTEWRPGTTEAWVMTTDWNHDNARAVWILRPDAPPVSVPGVSIWSVSTNGGWSGSSFTPDGTYWFSTTTSPNVAQTTVQVGPADDPTATGYNLNPPGTFLYHTWGLPDGRLLATSYVKDTDRSDANLIDPATGQTRLLGARGVLAGVGQTRFMGMFHLEESRGDLIAGGFDDQSPTKLADEFTVRTFAEPQGADLLAPGTRIVYQFQARAASPYDGIWVAECP